ncbi:hypothetical protein FSARC_13649 [Fusarium sarcochroum]|uniref:Pentatricopeptide repeat protein n=1 Tax=Fusarium sarcochroum TaxID=1208366 RepID=A0A8H4SZU5_9HYPO|nr:hypothetical protein FSARC_13649 [Fusarium sarcochroum]
MAGRMLNSGAYLRKALQHVPRQRLTIESAALFQIRSLQHSQRAFNSTTTITSTTAVENAIKTDAPKSLDVEVEPVDEVMSAKKLRLKMERTINKELEYINGDPWKVSKYVERALSQDRFDEAHLLVQTASKDMDVVVPWNILMNYLLEQQQVNKAIKLFNEMKKRAQAPTATTYTVLFRGLAKSQHPKLAVAEAVKHYNKLLKDGRLEPNSIHLNSVLNVCGRAGDLDSMFSIVDTINDSTRAPTAWTYSTIINALRHNVTNEIKDLPAEQQNYNVNNAIRRGKAVWEEVVSKWRAGRLVIDEELVCAMGRLIIISPDRIEKRETLDLLEQTMNIPNLSKVQEASAVEARKKDSKGQVALKDGRGSYVSPGTNTLSLILKTVATGRLSSIGVKYWNLVVREYKVEPDRDSWMRLFGLLKQAKASANASEILDIIPKDYINPRFYRIAMEACVRDNINLNAIKNSNRALDSMAKRLEVPDPHTMRIYLQVAKFSHYHLRARAEKGDVEGAKRAYGIQITNALSRMWELYRKLHEHFFVKLEAKTAKDKGVLYNDQREVIALARIMYGSYNKVIQQEMLPEEDLKKVRPLGGQINREIQDFFAKREEMEPNLRKSKGRGTAEEDMSEYNDQEDIDFFWDTTQAGKPKRDREAFKERDSRFGGRDNERDGSRQTDRTDRRDNERFSRRDNGRDNDRRTDRTEGRDNGHWKDKAERHDGERGSRYNRHDSEREMRFNKRDNGRDDGRRTGRADRRDDQRSPRYNERNNDRRADRTDRYDNERGSRYNKRDNNRRAWIDRGQHAADGLPQTSDPVQRRAPLGW